MKSGKDEGPELDSFVMVESADLNEATFGIMDEDWVVVGLWNLKAWNVERGARMLLFGSRTGNKS